MNQRHKISKDPWVLPWPESGPFPQIPLHHRGSNPYGHRRQFAWHFHAGLTRSRQRLFHSP